MNKTEIKNHVLDIQAITAATRMDKQQAFSLVRHLTESIAESTDGMIDVRVDLRNRFAGSIALISVGNQALFGSSSVIINSYIVAKAGA